MCNIQHLSNPLSPSVSPCLGERKKKNRRRKNEKEEGRRRKIRKEIRGKEKKKY
jgi:hypothetical protein